MKGHEESVARCDAAMSPIIDAVEHHLPAYDPRAVRYGFRRAWEIRDEQDRLGTDARSVIANAILAYGEGATDSDIVRILKEEVTLEEARDAWNSLA